MSSDEKAALQILKKKRKLIQTTNDDISLSPNKIINKAPKVLLVNSNLPANFFDEDNEQKVAEEGIQTSLQETSKFLSEYDVTRRDIEDFENDLEAIQAEIDIEEEKTEKKVDSEIPEDDVDADQEDEALDKNSERLIRVLHKSLGESISGKDVDPLKDSLLITLKASRKTSSMKPTFLPP